MIHEKACTFDHVNIYASLCIENTYTSLISNNYIGTVPGYLTVMCVLLTIFVPTCIMYEFFGQ